MICSALETIKDRGPDEVRRSFFDKSSIIHSLCQITRKACQTGIFPQKWKDFLNCPVFKKTGSKANVVHTYRPNSLLSYSTHYFALKALEKCHLLFVEVLSPQLHQNQFGSRSKRSGILQMLLYLNRIYKALGSRRK